MSTNMKKIVTFAFPRTGSNFFHSFFLSKKMYSYNAMEFFNAYPINQYKYIRHIYLNNNIKIPESFVEYQQKIIYGLFPELWFLRVKNLEQKQELVKQLELYNMNMLHDVCKTLEQLKYKCFFYKIIFNKTCREEWLDDMIKHSDDIIINYRRSILDVFISLHRAESTQLWYTNYKLDKSIYSPKYDATKMDWDLEEFKKFVRYYNNYYKRIISTIELNNKKYKVIEYEDFCKIKFKRKHIIATLKIDKHAVKRVSNYEKQSRSTNHEDAFNNPQDFLDDKEKVEKIMHCNLLDEMV